MSGFVPGVRELLDENEGSKLTSALSLGLAAGLSSLILNREQAIRQAAFEEGKHQGRLEGAQAAMTARIEEFGDPAPAPAPEPAAPAGDIQDLEARPV